MSQFLRRWIEGTRVACVVVALAAVATACGGSSNVDLADSSSSTDAAETSTSVVEFDKVVVAAQGSIDASPLWVAESEGFFADNRIDITFAPVDDEAALFSSISDGESDVAVVSAGTAVLRIAGDGEELEFVSYLDATKAESEETRGSMSLVGPTSFVVNSGCDLEQIRIGVDSLTSLAAVSVREMVTRDGCSPANVIFEVDTVAGHVASLAAGELDAVALQDPQTAHALRGDTNVVVNLDNELCPDFGRCPISVVVGDREWVSQNPDVVRRFYLALDDAILWIRANELPYRAELISCCAVGADDASEIRVPDFVGNRRYLPTDLNRLVDILVGQGHVDQVAVDVAFQ